MLCSALDVECLDNWHSISSCTKCGLWMDGSARVFDAYSVNAAEEKSLVKEVFTNAIDCLSEDDKKLPQVGTVWHAHRGCSTCLLYIL